MSDTVKTVSEIVAAVEDLTASAKGYEGVLFSKKESIKQLVASAQTVIKNLEADVALGLNAVNADLIPHVVAEAKSVEQKVVAEVKAVPAEAKALTLKAWHFVAAIPGAAALGAALAHFL